MVTSFESVVEEEGGLSFLQGLGHSLLDALVSGGRIFADFAGGEAIVNKWSFISELLLFIFFVLFWYESLVEGVVSHFLVVDVLKNHIVVFLQFDSLFLLVNIFAQLPVFY